MKRLVFRERKIKRSASVGLMNLNQHLYSDIIRLNRIKYWYKYWDSSVSRKYFLGKREWKQLPLSRRIKARIFVYFVIPTKSFLFGNKNVFRN